MVMKICSLVNVITTEKKNIRHDLSLFRDVCNTSLHLHLGDNNKSAERRMYHHTHKY